MGKAFPIGLVVDDEPAVRELIALWLDRLGYAPTQAATGREAIEHLAWHTFDLVVLDIHMPEVNGLQVLDAARRSHEDACILVLTGPPQSYLLDQALTLGADAVVRKPCTIDDIATAMRTAQFQRARAQRFAAHG